MTVVLATAWVRAEAPAPSAGQAWDKIKTDLGTLQSAMDESGVTKLAPVIETETKDFFTKYPDDAHALNATMLWAQLGQEMNTHGWKGGPSPAEIDKTFDALASNDKVPEARRAEIRAMQIKESIEGALASNDAAAWDKSEKQFSEFEKTFGDGFTADGQTPIVPVLREQELRILAEGPDTARYEALVKKLAASPDENLQKIAAEAQEHQKVIADLKTKPVDLKFTAVDGRKVDLSKLRGKAVLVDFWATWCGPCRAEMPNVLAAYSKFHDKGLEVVGVSLDQDKDTMLGFIKNNGMAWPQFFDGNGWDNEISSKYGIKEIPEMWLIDKNGMLVSQNAAEDLDGKVTKLLEAP